jgi:hypothetical protein
MLPSTSFGSTSTSTRTRESGSSFTVVSMEETTLDTGARQRVQMGAGDRFAAWLYTGAPGRLASFSIDLSLSVAALGVWSTRRVWRRVRNRHSPAA